MREIKFRGKRIDNIKHEKKEFVYGSLLYINDYNYDWDGSKSGKKEEVYFIVDETDINIIVSKDTIGQYIGLKDENGKEIYKHAKIVNGIFQRESTYFGNLEGTLDFMNIDFSKKKERKYLAKNIEEMIEMFQKALEELEA